MRILHKCLLRLAHTGSAVLEKELVDLVECILTMSEPLILPWLLCSCLLSAVTLAVLYLKRKMNGFVPGNRSPPSLPSLPIIGSLLSLVSDSPPHIFFQQLQKKYGDIYSLMMGSHKILIVNNHHHAKEVLIKKGKIFAGRPRSVSKLL